MQRELETLLRPLGSAELRARFALQTSAHVEAGQLEASLEIVGSAHPLTLRSSLTSSMGAAQGRARQAASSVIGPVGATFEAAAGLLDSCRLSHLDRTVDGLLGFLDPEPIARELDALVVAIFTRLPQIAARFQSAFEELIARFTRLTRDLNPLVLAQRYLKVIDVVRQELDVLNPRRLVRELSEVHAALREAVTAYDPGAFVPDLRALIHEVAEKIRGLDIEALFGDLSSLDTALARLDAAVPAQALSNVGVALSDVSARLAAIDLAGIVDAVDALGPRVIAQFERAVDAIRDEIVALLQSLRYATGGASASVSASASANG
jgi:hypothetical protein